MRRMNLEGKTVLVTGAGSGIGRGLAHELARRGCNLALVDIDAAGLDETAASIAPGTQVSRHMVDLGDAAAIRALPEAILREHAGIDVLVNNAGVGLWGSFEQIAEEDFDWLLSINLFGVIRMTRAFLPLLRRAPQGWLVNVSSVFGIIAPPDQTAYCTAKFGVRGFSDSLRKELAGSNVGITIVYPGGVATGLARSARVPTGISRAERDERLKHVEKIQRLSPDQAAAAIVRAVERRSRHARVGADAKVASLIERVLPNSYWSLLKRAQL